MHIQQAQAAAQFVGVGGGVQTRRTPALPPAGKRLRRQHRHFLCGASSQGGVWLRQQFARRAQRIAQTNPGQAQRIQRRQPRRARRPAPARLTSSTRKAVTGAGLAAWPRW